MDNLCGEARIQSSTAVMQTLRGGEDTILDSGDISQCFCVDVGCLSSEAGFTGFRDLRDNRTVLIENCCL